MQTHRQSAARTIEPCDFLLPDPSLRRRDRPQAPRPVAVEDAVFEVVGPAGRIHPRHNDNPAPARPSRDTQPLPAIARMAGRLLARAERYLAGMSPQAFTTLLSTLAVLVFWICGGFSALITASAAGPAAPFELLRPVIHAEDANGMKIAFVTGAVRNTSGRIIRAPRLSIVSGTRQEIIGTVRLPMDRIGPGVTIPFSGRFKLAGGKSADLAIIPERL